MLNVLQGDDCSIFWQEIDIHGLQNNYIAGFFIIWNYNAAYLIDETADCLKNVFFLLGESY